MRDAKMFNSNDWQRSPLVVFTWRHKLKSPDVSWISLSLSLTADATRSSSFGMFGHTLASGWQARLAQSPVQCPVQRTQTLPGLVPS